MDNYFRKIVKPDQTFATDPDIAMEDREKWQLDRVAFVDSLNEHNKIERVISSLDGEETTQYLVKWKGLPYKSCTWEDASLVSELAQIEIDRYLDRSVKVRTSNKKESRLETRSEYKPFFAQPSYIKGGELRDFQITGLNFLGYNWCLGHNVILADEMGLGKTVQTCAFLDWLRHDRGQQGPFIVIVPLSTVPAWADTLNNWTPDLNYVVYTGDIESRKMILEYETNFNVLLTTYEMASADAHILAPMKWQFLAVDEAHRLKDRQSQLYGKLLEFGAPSRLLITGTPMQNTLSELSSLMDFLMPGKVHIDESIDLTSEHAGEKIKELNDAISPYMLRRTKKKVENDLPPKTEKIIRVELSDVQLDYYKNILTRNYDALNAGSKGQKTSLLNIMMELKKASNHPFLFPNAEDRLLRGRDARDDQLKALITSSGKMMLLDQLLTKLKKDNHRVLIFSQMVRMLDILGDYLQLRGHQFQRLDGTISAGTRRLAIDHFNAPDSQDFCFLLSTRAGGLGINLMTADTVILFDSDWNPQADLQAMARAHRIGQKNPVSIYRLVSKDTVEEEVLERARNKLMLEFITIHKGVTDKERKDNPELDERIAKASANAAEPKTSDDISQILKRRGQKMFEQSGNQRKLEELDIDAVLENAEEHQTEQPESMPADGGAEFLRNFEYTDVKVDLTWDQIIPRDALEKSRDAERKEKEEQETKRMIDQSGGRKRKAADDDDKAHGRAAKKRARDLNAQRAELEQGAESGDGSDNGSNPERELSEKECRHLIRAFERFGSIEEKEEELVAASRLRNRDREVVKNTLKEILDVATRKRDQSDAQLADKTITKKDKKAILFDFRQVKRLNAETLTERPIEMRMIRQVVGRLADPKTFRVPEAQKPASYSCEWGAREDGMLCVGIAKHGFGAWALIRDDPVLGMQDKMFLEEHRVDKREERSRGEEKQPAKSPGAVHLVRRANYLLNVLKDKTSGGTNMAARLALENHHRSNRKVGQMSGRLSTPSRSPAPNAMRNRIDGQVRINHYSHRSPNGHRRVGSGHQGASEERRPSQPQNKSIKANGRIQANNGVDGEMDRMFQPLESVFVNVSRATKKRMPDDNERLRVIKECLLTIGAHIERHLENARPGGSALGERMWRYVTDKYWPQSRDVKNIVTWQKLKDMHFRILHPPPSKGTAKSGTVKTAEKEASNGHGSGPSPSVNGVSLSKDSRGDETGLGKPAKVDKDATSAKAMPPIPSQESAQRNSKTKSPIDADHREPGEI